MLYIVVLMAILAGFLHEKSKIIYILQLVLIWILLGWSYGNADYQNYLARYNYYYSSDLAQRSEWLFIQLFKFGNKLGLSYEEFLPILAFVYVLILGICVKKLSANPNFVLSLYMIFPACAEATQIRFAIAGAIVIIGFMMLLDENIKRGEIYYVLIVLVASLLHMGTFVFMAMTPIRRLNKRQTFLYTFAVIIVLVILGSVGLNAIISLFPGMDIKLSLMSSYSIVSIRYWIFVQFTLWVFFLGMTRLFEGYCHKNNISENGNRFDLIVKIGIISAVTFPITFMTQDVYRIHQCICILCFCSLSNVFPVGLIKIDGARRMVSSKNKITLSIGCVIFAFMYLYVIVLSSSNINTVFKPYFENNKFFEVVFQNWR